MINSGGPWPCVKSMDCSSSVIVVVYSSDTLVPSSYLIVSIARLSFGFVGFVEGGEGYPTAQ